MFAKLGPLQTEKIVTRKSMVKYLQLVETPEI